MFESEFFKTLDEARKQHANKHNLESFAPKRRRKILNHP
jgi:hypothetical protein